MVVRAMEREPMRKRYRDALPPEGHAMRLAFFGTGLMGTGFVRRLRANGHEVNVWNRSAEKARALEAHGAKRFRRPGRGARWRRAHPPVAGRRRVGRRRAGADRREDSRRHLDRRPHHHRSDAHGRARRALERARPHLRARAGVHGSVERAGRHRADAAVGRQGAPRRAAAGAAADDRQGRRRSARRPSGRPRSSSSATSR